jgi:hypothetical protein
LIKQCFVSFVYGKWKSLDTGAVPTENLPLKSHEVKHGNTRPGSCSRTSLKLQIVPK